MMRCLFLLATLVVFSFLAFAGPAQSQGYASPPGYYGAGAQPPVTQVAPPNAVMPVGASMVRVMVLSGLSDTLLNPGFLSVSVI